MGGWLKLLSLPRYTDDAEKTRVSAFLNTILLLSAIMGVWEWGLLVFRL